MKPDEHKKGLNAAFNKYEGMDHTITGEELHEVIDFISERLQ